MEHAQVEHVNITVKDIDETSAFLLAAIPDWRIRGHGTMAWFGKQIRWLHVGTDSTYVALQGGGEGGGPHWREHRVGVKHIGIVVPDLDAVVDRLSEAGYRVDHSGASHPSRRSAYFIERDELQFEFVEYSSGNPAERNDYGT